MSDTGATVEYVYGVVPATVVVTGAPPGMDRMPVRSVAHGDLMALVTSVDAALYAGDAVSTRMEDPEWLTPRAVIHDAIVTWASDRGAVVPFPMWVMFSDEMAVSAMLGGRSAEFHATLQRVSDARELCVRVYADRTALTAAARMDSALAELEQRAQTASAGQAYLLRRKLAEAEKAATRDVAARIAEETHGALAGHARESVARATSASEEPGILLDGAYLVANDRYDAFRAAVTDLVARYLPSGLRFDFTGPWPPYHFVRDN